MRFDVAAGSFCVNGMATTSPDIVFKAGAGVPAKPLPARRAHRRVTAGLRRRRFSSLPTPSTLR